GCFVVGACYLYQVATAPDVDVGAINRLLCESATRVVVAADATKLGRRAFARICETERVDTLVTDTAVSEEMAARFRDAGVSVVTA
ncbi:hypothetical protein ACFVZ2_45300, partial [Streptomyces lasiicapitis]